jgi:hypothetical protein
MKLPVQVTPARIKRYFGQFLYVVEWKSNIDKIIIEASPLKIRGPCSVGRSKHHREDVVFLTSCKA